MARQTWVQCRHTGEFIPKDEYYETAPSGPFVMADIKPYKSMIDGSTIQGRRQHREHLRQHGCIEVGNERLTPKKPTTLSREERKRDLHSVLNGMGL